MYHILLVPKLQGPMDIIRIVPPPTHPPTHPPIQYAVYHILLVPKLQGPMDVIRIEGEYPFVRYFSYQSYDPKSMDPVASVVDFDVSRWVGGWVSLYECSLLPYQSNHPPTYLSSLD